jgi:hypothetical protein
MLNFFHNLPAFSSSNFLFVSLNNNSEKECSIDEFEYMFNKDKLFENSSIEKEDNLLLDWI